uniref:Reverse transcriptase domain-containing protein n=1 Tax=Plectus sambesii TaxID=2011161 RepID=A0A914WZ99_9BILA
MLMEKHHEQQQPLHLTFIDMEKAYDHVPRDLIWWVLWKKQVPEQYVHIIQDMVHQGSALSPYLFITVLDIICQDLLEPAPWTMLCVDDVVLCARNQGDLERKLQKWKDCIHQHGLQINTTKTEYMAAGPDAANHNTIHLDGIPITRVKSFKYLDSVPSEEGNINADVKSRMACSWLKWWECSGVLCNKKMLL